ncbi:MAG: pyridoxamine 5'-phosphate oxidase family protein [Mogibacterium sp.]|nr:pyridoxamine 5'-phosphate oxidase family protein [Mogibacterium sp.]
MFRTMRRSPQALSHEEMIELLKTETRGVMSVQGDNGYPYGYPINHYYDEEANKIYIHGATFGHRVSAVKKDPKVSYCVFGGEYHKEGDWAKYVKSVIIFGKAELVEDADEIVRISRLLCDKFPCPPEYVEHEIEKDAPRTLVIAINIENMNGKLVHEA